MKPILPSEAAADPGSPSGRPGQGRPPWGPFHAALHRRLRRDPDLLPAGAPLLLAVSGGQDSMALTKLLQDLGRLHGWRLQLWHGDHGWRPESARQAAELQAWAEGRGLPITVERASAPPAHEAAARAWRYDRLERLALERACTHVVTGHTASDRAETLLLHLARGSHRQGLASLRRRRPLSVDSPVSLVRPLLDLGRADTGQFCAQWELPIWLDPSNSSPRFSRNRIRLEVMPVLEELHPGCASRIGALAERLEAEQNGSEELLDLALGPLSYCPPQAPAPARPRPSPNTHAGAAQPAQAREPGPETRPAPALDRLALTRLGLANQGRLLHHWLKRHSGLSLEAACLEALLAQLQPENGPGEQPLGQGWRLAWTRPRLVLRAPGTVAGPGSA